MFLADMLVRFFRISMMVFHHGGVNYNAVMIANTIAVDFFLDLDGIEEITQAFSSREKSLWRGIREHMQPWEHGTTFTAFVNEWPETPSTLDRLESAGQNFKNTSIQRGRNARPTTRPEEELVDSLVRSLDREGLGGDIRLRCGRWTSSDLGRSGRSRWTTSCKCSRLDFGHIGEGGV